MSENVVVALMRALHAVDNPLHLYTCVNAMLTDIHQYDSYQTYEIAEGVHKVTSYFKGIYHALLGRVEFEDYDCRPAEEINIDEFSDRITEEYSEALELLAE